MNFLHPMMLAGLAAVSVPIIIHLLNKFRVRTTDWGAMRFLLDSIQKNQKRVKMEDLILLILRCLLVALAVFAFARPVLTALVKGGADDGEAVAAVILLDNSASMSRSAGATTLFDQAKKEIGTWLDKQPSQSLAALYLVSNRTEALVPKPGPDLGLVRKMLSEAEAGDRGTDLAQAVRLAVDSLKTIGGRPRQILIYTDGQASGWAKNAEILTLAEDNPGIRIKTVIVGDKVADNVGLVALRADGGVVAARQPCRFHIEVGNYGTTAVENLKVTLAIGDGPPMADATIARIEPGTRQAASVIISFPDAGPQSLVASIPPDAFAADNKRVAALDVVSQMNVLVAEENPSVPAVDRDGFFVANALVPLSPDQMARHFLAAVPTSIADLPAELANRNNTAAQSIFLCNPGPLSSTVTTALKDYVGRGGNLIIFPGPQTNPDDWKANTALQELLPAELGVPTEEAEGAVPRSFQSTAFSHPVTALWNDSAQGSLSAVKFFRHFPLTLKTTGTPRVIAQLANGEPAVVEWTVGEGNVVLFNSAATPEWNNLPLHPAFVPFLQRLMGHLNRRNESRLILSPGEAFRKPVDEQWKGSDFSVRRPSSDSSRTAGQVVSDDKQTFVRYASTEKAGIYQVSVGNDLIATFAVQIDPAESDLRQLDPEIIAGLESAGDEAEKTEVTRSVVTREFWTLLLWIVAAIFVVEAIMAHRISHTRSV
jgi:hypothetical protein